MNRWAMLAQASWEKNAPDLFRQIKDPAAFFAELGTEAQRQIDLATDSVPEVPGETFLDRWRRLAQAQATAEEIVRRELLTPPLPDVETLDPVSGIPVDSPESPEDQELRQALTDFQDARSQLATQ